MAGNSKDPAAVSLGKKRAAQAKETNPDGMRDLGALGGKAAAAGLTAGQRKARASAAAAARWGEKKPGKRKGKPKLTAPSKRSGKAGQK